MQLIYSCCPLISLPSPLAPHPSPLAPTPSLPSPISDKRFYLVSWKGKNTSAAPVAGTLPGDPWPPTWEPARYLDTAPHAVDTFWMSAPYALTDTIEDPSEFRCVDFSASAPGYTTATLLRTCSRVRELSVSLGSSGVQDVLGCGVRPVLSCPPCQIFWGAVEIFEFQRAVTAALLDA